MATAFSNGERAFAWFRLGFSVFLMGVAALKGAQVAFYSQIPDRAEAAQVQMAHLAAQIEAYRADHGLYPDSLTTLLRTQSRTGPYVNRPETLHDPWGQPYRYTLRHGGTTYALVSLGADHSKGGRGEAKDVAFR